MLKSSENLFHCPVFPEGLFEGKKELRFISEHLCNSKEPSAALQDSWGLRAYRHVMEIKHRISIQQIALSQGNHFRPRHYLVVERSYVHGLFGRLQTPGNQNVGLASLSRT